jgi:hypothetical protein
VSAPQYVDFLLLCVQEMGSRHACSYKWRKVQIDKPATKYAVWGVAGTSKRAGLESLADALLSSAARMSGVLSRSEGLPVLGLAAGVASGSCFVQYECK